MLDSPGEVAWCAFGTIDLRVIYTRKYGSNPAPLPCYTGFICEVFVEKLLPMSPTGLSVSC